MTRDLELNFGQPEFEFPIRQPREVLCSLGSLECREGCRVEIQISGSSACKWHFNT